MGGGHLGACVARRRTHALKVPALHRAQCLALDAAHRLLAQACARLVEAELALRHPPRGAGRAAAVEGRSLAPNRLVVPARAIAPAAEAATEGARAVPLLAVVAVVSGRLQAALPALEDARVHPRRRRAKRPCHGLAVRAVLDVRGGGTDPVGLLFSAAWCGVTWRSVAWRGVAWRGAARRTDLKTLIGLHSK